MLHLKQQRQDMPNSGYSDKVSFTKKMHLGMLEEKPNKLY